MLLDRLQVDICLPDGNPVIICALPLALEIPLGRPGKQAGLEIGAELQPFSTVNHVGEAVLQSLVGAGGDRFNPAGFPDAQKAQQDEPGRPASELLAKSRVSRCLWKFHRYGADFEQAGQLVHSPSRGAQPQAGADLALQ